MELGREGKKKKEEDQEEGKKQKSRESLIFT
jgi:hypothetical protein